MKLFKKFSVITILFLILTGCEISLNAGKSLDTSDLDLNSMSAGTVVKLKGLDKKVMIYGQNPLRVADGKRYRYLGCFYPEGYTSDDENVFFDPKQIEKVYHLGYKKN